VRFLLEVTVRAIHIVAPRRRDRLRLGSRLVRRLPHFRQPVASAAQKIILDCFLLATD
jgi:hypothetical protein